MHTSSPSPKFFWPEGGGHGRLPEKIWRIDGGGGGEVRTYVRTYLLTYLTV